VDRPGQLDKAMLFDIQLLERGEKVAAFFFSLIDDNNWAN
jgi:hypothetical protein